MKVYWWRAIKVGLEGFQEREKQLDRRVKVEWKDRNQKTLNRVIRGNPPESEGNNLNLRIDEDILLEWMDVASSPLSYPSWQDRRSDSLIFYLLPYCHI